MACSRLVLAAPAACFAYYSLLFQNITYWNLLESAGKDFTCFRFIYKSNLIKFDQISKEIEVETTPSVPNYKSFQEFWKIKKFQI